MPAQLLAFYCKRLLDLHDQLGVPIDGIGVCDDRRASGFVVAVWQARFGADASFYENPVTPVGEFADRRWYDTDPVFIVLDLFWHTDEHDYFS